MANIDHQNLTGAAAAHPPWYSQSTDPGAVGAGKAWVDTSTAVPYQLKKRNAANSAWENIGVISSITDPTTTRGDLIVRDVSALGRFAVGAANTVLGSNGTDPAWTTAPTVSGELTALDLKATGMTGAANSVRVVGGNATGAPTTGTFAVRDLAVDSDGTLWICTAAGSPGTWTQVSGSGGSSGGSGSGVAGSGALVPISVFGPITTATATIPFASIPQTGYRNLRLVITGRGDTAATSSVLRINFNTDTGTNYNSQVGSFSSGTAAGSRTTSETFGRIANLACASALGSSASAITLDILNYVGTSHFKTWMSDSFVNDNSVPAPEVNTHSGYWASTAAITSLSLSLASGNFDVGTYVCLYGEMDTTGVLLTPATNLLYEKVLTASAASINTGTFSQAYRDLQVEVVARGDTAAQSTTVGMRFNGDGGTNYTYIQHRANASSSGATTSTGQTSGGALSHMPANTATANIFGSTTIRIANYTASVGFRTWTSSGFDLITNVVQADNYHGYWANTSAITSITLTPGAGNFVAGTTVRVYGLPASAGGTSVGTGTRLRIAGNLSVSDVTDTIVGWDTEDDDADSQHYMSAASLTGTVAKAAASSTLTGTGTAFTTELSIGQVISVPGTAVEKRVVIGIASATSLTVDSAYANTASGQTATRVNSAVVFRQSGHYSLDAGAYWASDADGDRKLAIILNDTTPIAQDNRLSIGAAVMGQTVSLTRPFRQWDFVEVQVRHAAGAALNLTADERTFFSISARPTVIVAVPYLSVQDRKTAGTEGGTFTTGAWRTRDLNTVASDTAGIASLASNQITLAAGVYRCVISVPAYSCNSHVARLQNTTAATTLLTGTASRSPASGSVDMSQIRGRFTLSVPSALEVQHSAETTRATDGFGISAAVRVDPDAAFDIYTVAEFWKEG